MFEKLKNISRLMFDDVVQDVMTHVESVVSGKVGELDERLSMLLSGCAKEASVRDEVDALKVLLASVETRFREEHTALVEAINAHTAATKAQTTLLEALCGEVRTMNERVDALCSHTGRLGNIERDVASIAGSVQGLEKTDTFSSDVSSRNERIDNIRPVAEHKASEVKKAEEKRLAKLKAEEEKTRAEEVARQKEERERDKMRKAEEAMRTSFSGKDSEIMAKGVNALKQWTRKATATVVYDSTVDGFTDDRLFTKVKGKPNIALIGFTTDGDVFGGFYRIAVTEQVHNSHDPDIFIFSFESHGRCETPMKFDVWDVEKEDAYVRFWNSDSNGFVDFWVDGVGGFFLGNEWSESYCENVSRGFEGLEDTTLMGKNGTFDKGPFHRCTRLVAVQLE